MGTATLNAAFIREIRADSRQLSEVLSSLRELTQNSMVLRNHRGWIVDLLGQLRDQLAIHFSLEEAYGGFDDAEALASRMSCRAETLRAEHAVLFESIRGIAEQAEQCRNRHRQHLQQTVKGHADYGPDAQEFHRIIARFHHFDQHLSRHEEQENELFLDSFDRDIGIGD